MSDTAISLTNVSMRFGQVSAVEDIDLVIKEGEFVSFIGPSGCGKTTLLRIIAGIEKRFSGEVKINGSSPQRACKNHDIGVAFQQSALLPWRTALENVRLTLEITNVEDGLSPKDLLDQFGLGEFLDHHPGKLSGGMQQRVNIAAALVHNPKVLLLDEPFGALDELTRESMCDWLSRVLIDTPKTVVFVTHSVEEAVFLSDRVIVLSPRPGKLEEDVSIPFKHPRTRSLRTDLTFLDYVAEVRKRLYEVVGINGNGVTTCAEHT